MVLLGCSWIPQGYALGVKEAASSLILPTTGQAMNGEIGTGKTKIMAGIEAAAITTAAVLGVATGGGIVWLGVAPLIANHVWSAADAYKGAKRKYYPYVQQQVIDSERSIDLSRQRRFDREQVERTSFHERLKRAQEAFNNPDASPTAD